MQLLLSRSIKWFFVLFDASEPEDGADALRLAAILAGLLHASFVKCFINDPSFDVAALLAKQIGTKVESYNNA